MSELTGIAETIQTQAFTGSSQNQLMADVGGDTNEAAVVLLHGGGQTRHSWGPAQRELIAAGYHAVSLDARGHGESAWMPDGNYALDSLVDDVRAVVAQIGKRPVLIGASMGGVCAMIACGRDPSLASALVLVDVAPTLELAGIELIHRFMKANPDGFASLEEAADAIAAYNPLRPRPRSTQGLQKNLRLRADGRWHWHWDPKMFESNYQTKLALMQAQMIDAASRITIPVLLLRGKESDVLGPQGVAELQALLPQLTFVDIAGAGHMIAGDRNDMFNAAILTFLEAHVPRAA